MSSSLSSSSFDGVELAHAFSRLTEEQGNAVLALLKSFGISVGGETNQNKLAEQGPQQGEDNI
eukprot:10486038-Ditylum_brightwellii.AAC.1